MIFSSFEGMWKFKKSIFLSLFIMIRIFPLVNFFASKFHKHGILLLINETISKYEYLSDSFI